MSGESFRFGLAPTAPAIDFEVVPLERQVLLQAYDFNDFVRLDQQSGLTALPQNGFAVGILTRKPALKKGILYGHVFLTSNVRWSCLPVLGKVLSVAF